MSFTYEDWKKHDERKHAISNYKPKPTKAMKGFSKRLRVCPICGSVPKISWVDSKDSWEDEEDSSFKFTCSWDWSHICGGEWFPTVAKAGKSWNERVREYFNKKGDE